MTRTAGGNLVLACSAGVGHNMGGSGLAVSVSTDCGRNFSAPKMLRSFPRFDNRYQDCGNYAIGIAEDGAVILLAMAFNPKEKLNTIFGFRSEDEGESWQPVETTNLAENKTGAVYGHIFNLPNGRLGVVGHYRPGSRPCEQGIWMSFSDDNGKSWSSAGRAAGIAACNGCELRSIGSERQLYLCETYYVFKGHITTRMQPMLDTAGGRQV